MLQCIQKFTDTFAVTMKGKCYIGKIVLYKLIIYYEYLCLCWVSTLFVWFVVCFPNVLNILQYDFDPFITFYLHCTCSTFWGSPTHRNAVKRCIESCLYRCGKKRLSWIALRFIFKPAHPGYASIVHFYCHNSVEIFMSVFLYAARLFLCSKSLVWP